MNLLGFQENKRYMSSKKKQFQSGQQNEVLRDRKTIPDHATNFYYLTICMKTGRHKQLKETEIIRDLAVDVTVNIPL